MRDTRAELLMEAEILIRGRGYSGFSYADLADAVGIRKASIHHHFRTKEDLGVALIAAYGERYDRALAEIVTSGGSGLTRIEAYGRLYLGGVEKGLGCLCAALAVELETLPTVLRTDIARFLDHHIAWVRQALLQGIADGSIRTDVDAAASARMVIATLEGALLIERLLAGPPGFEQALGAMLDMLRTHSA